MVIPSSRSTYSEISEADVQTEIALNFSHNNLTVTTVTDRPLANFRFSAPSSPYLPTEDEFSKKSKLAEKGTRVFFFQPLFLK